MIVKVFSQTPNLGNSKQIVEIVPSADGENEVEVPRGDLELIRTRNEPIESFTPAESPEPAPELAHENEPEEELVTTSKQTRAQTIRSQVATNQDKSANNMATKHNNRRNKRTRTFDVGDSVSVLIPRIDRGGSDLPRLPGVVGRVSREYYEIVTQYGILNDCLMASELEDYHGILGFEPESISNKITLRELLD